MGVFVFADIFPKDWTERKFWKYFWPRNSNDTGGCHQGNGRCRKKNFLSKGIQIRNER